MADQGHARTVLPWMWRGRHIRPYVIATTLGDAILAVIILSGTSGWGTADDLWSSIIAAGAITAAAFLAAAFFLRSAWLMNQGLVLSAAVFAARGVYIGLIGGNWWTAALSWCWALSAAGAHLLEAAWARMRDERGSVPAPPGGGAWGEGRRGG